MKKHWRWIVLGCLFIAVGGVIGIKLAANRGPEEAYDTGPAAEEQVQPIAGLPTLLDLGAGTCIPCKMMAPILDELKRDYRGKVNVILIDVNENREEALKHNIYTIPTQIFFDATGKELYRHEGFMAKADIITKFVTLGMVK